jgi:hypothetical protein
MKRKRPYRYKPTTLTLDRLIGLIDSGQEVIDLNRFSNGESWFRSLSRVLPVMNMECSPTSPGERVRGG